MSRLWHVLLLAALGCGSAASGAGGEGDGTDGTAGGETAPWLGSDDSSVSERMRRIAAGMRDAGLELGSIGNRGFLTQGERRTEAIDIPAGTCATIVAIAARGVRDLDATLFSPAGDVLAEDIEPDAHPTIQVCASDEPRRLYYGLHSYAGAGAFLYGSFVGERESFEAAARVVGGSPGVVSGGSEGSGVDTRLQEVRAGVARRGFRPHGDPAPVQLAADQRVRLPLGAQRGHCYTVVALGTEGLSDVDVRVLDELDRELASDSSPTAEASAQLCVDRDAALVAEVHAAEGEGVAQVVYFRATESTAGGTSGLWLGERRESRLASAPVERTTREALGGARDAGWGAPSRVASGRLGSGEAVEHELGLRGGRCSLVVATGGTGTATLHLRLLDEEGQLLSEATGMDGTVSVRLCPAQRRAARAILVSRRGGGDYRLHRLERPAPEELPTDAPPTVRGALLDGLDEARGEGWELLDGPGALPLADGQATFRPPADRCVRVLAASAAPLTAELLRGERVSQRSSGRSAWLLACPSGDAPAATVRVLAEQPVWRLVLGRR